MSLQEAAAFLLVAITITCWLTLKGAAHRTVGQSTLSKYGDL